MALTQGRAEVVVGLLDGPVALEHPGLATGNLRMLSGSGACRGRDPGSEACRHGTFVAGILAAPRGARAPAIAPGCTFLVRPIFTEMGLVGELPSAEDVPRPVELRWRLGNWSGGILLGGCDSRYGLVERDALGW
jgi:hypothetical protein